MEHQQWQSLLTNGNECFHDGRWLQAEYYYTEAYELLADAYHHHPYSSDILMAWICTCHNLSSLFEAQGEMEVALRYLKLPHEYLVNLADHEQSSEDVKLIAIKALSITVKPILAFSKKHPICDSCLNELTRLQSMLNDLNTTLH